MNRVAVVLILLQAVAAPTPQPKGTSVPAAVGQTDEYTRYELLAPETATFKETFEVSVTSPGALDYADRVLPGPELSHRFVHSLGGLGNIRREDPPRFRQRPPLQHRRPHQGPPPAGFLTRSPS